MILLGRQCFHSLMQRSDNVFNDAPCAEADRILRFCSTKAARNTLALSLHEQKMKIILNTSLLSLLAPSVCVLFLRTLFLKHLILE